MFDKSLFALPGIRVILALLGVLACLQATAIIGQALTLATALSNLWQGSVLESQAGWIAGFFGCFLARQAIVLVQDAMLSRYAAGVAAALREQLLHRALAGSAGWVRAHGTARVTTSVLEGIDQVENYLNVILPKVLNLGVILPATLVTAFVLDWVSAVILLVVLPVVVFYMIMLGRMAQDRAARQYGTYQVLSNHFMDTLRGLSTLKVFGVSKRHTAEVYRVSEEFREATVNTLRVATLSSVVLDLLATLGVAAVAMLLGFRLVVGDLSLFVGLACLIIAPEYFAPLRDFSGDFHASLDGRNALADIQSLVAEPRGDAAAAPPVLWGPDSTLRLEDLSFSYPTDSAQEPGVALRSVSLEARGCQRIGIIGASGSGKSTLASVLGGFLVPQSGAIFVDGAPLPLDAFTQEAWRRNILYIPQDPHIFRATLRENITFYTPDAPQEEVLRAIEAVGLSSLVEELPQGLDTLIGDGGRSLSGGQAQRIALARAFLDSSRRILIFDEPTAHLDIETELELKERMLPLMEGRLVLFATHRLHWVQDMDQVISMSAGSVASQHPAPAPGAKVAPTDAPDTVPEPAPGAAPSRHPEPADGAAPLCHPAPAPGAAPLCHPERSAKRGVEGSPAGGNRSQLGGDPSTPLPSVAPLRMTRGAAFGNSARDDDGAAFGRCARGDRGEVPSRSARDGKGAHPSRSARKDTWVRPYFGRYRKQLVSALGLGVAAFAFAALLMFTAGYLISGTAEARGSILFYYLPIAFVQLFGLGKPLLRYFERLQSHDWLFRMTSSLRVRLYKALERQAMKPGGQSMGEVLGLVAEDIGHIQNLYLRTVFPLVIAWALYLLMVVAFGLSDPSFALAMLVLMGAVAVVAPLVSVAANRACIERRKTQKMQLYEQLTDDMLGASDWVFSGRGPQGAARRVRQAARVHRHQERLDRYERWNGLVVAVLMSAISVLVLCWAALRFGGAPGGEANLIAAFVLGFLPLVETFSPLATAATQADVHRDSIRRLNEYPETDDAVDVEEDAPLVPAGLSLEARGLSFAYPGAGGPVLDGVDLQVPLGQRVAILGRSGSGKSTFLALARGDLAPTAGSIELGGRAAADYGDGIVRLVGVVQQDAYLFDRSLRENLVLGKLDAGDDEIWEVLGRVRLDALVRGLPQGLDTRVDEAGMRFSGGERHRIALARVLLADAPIILLDEPTVGLDPVTEQGILDTLMEVTRGKTLVMITHHLQGIEAFDRVVFLEDGRLELDGSPEELARTSTRYRRLLAFDRA